VCDGFRPLADAVIRIRRRIFSRRKSTANAVRRRIFRRRKFCGAVRQCAEKIKLLNRVCFIRNFRLMRLTQVLKLAANLLTDIEVRKYTIFFQNFTIIHKI